MVFLKVGAPASPLTRPTTPGAYVTPIGDLSTELDALVVPVPQRSKKTELCTYWESGSCHWGNDCWFAHGNEELRPVIRHPKYKTARCTYFPLVLMVLAADFFIDHWLEFKENVDCC